MSRSSAYLLTCLLALISSCGPTSSDAAAYNDRLIEEQNKVANKGEAFFAAMDLTPEEMKKAFESFKAQVLESLAATEQTEPFEKDSAFYKACIRALELQRSLCEKEYPLVIELLSKPDDALTEEDTEQYSLLINAIDEQQKKVLEELTSSQSAFASTWNFTIDPTKTFE